MSDVAKAIRHDVVILEPTETRRQVLRVGYDDLLPTPEHATPIARGLVYIRKLEEQVHRKIEREFKNGRETLQEEVLEKAMAKAEEMIKTRISTEDHERLVDEYLDKVVA